MPTLERSQGKRSRITDHLARFPVGDLYELLRPHIHNALGRPIPGHAGQIDGADIRHITIGEGCNDLAGFKIPQTAFERGPALIDNACGSYFRQGLPSQPHVIRVSMGLFLLMRAPDAKHLFYAFRVTR